MPPPPGAQQCADYLKLGAYTLLHSTVTWEQSAQADSGSVHVHLKSGACNSTRAHFNSYPPIGLTGPPS